MADSERPKFIIEERPDNAGASLDQPEILSAAVKDVSQSLDIGAMDADWYMLGKDNELYALDVEEETVLRENPQWRDLANSADLSVHEHEDARKHFPDVEAKEVTAQPYPIDPEQSMEIGAAFEGPRIEAASQGLDQWHLTEREWLEASLPSEHRPDNDLGQNLEPSSMDLDL
jgi:hypothetical protein